MNRATGLADQRVLLLGASGFIGRWVASRLERQGRRLTAVVRDAEAAAPALEMARVETAPLVADLGDLDEVGRIIAEIQPHLTFNLAGYGVDSGERDSHDAERINHELPKRLADELWRLGQTGGSMSDAAPRLVHVGSALEYGVVERVGETDPVRPTTTYGKTKLAGTEAVSAAADAGLSACTARLFTVYGPGEHEGRLLPDLLAVVGTNTPLDLTDGLQERDFTYVDDVVEGLIGLARVARTPAVVNLATGQLSTVRRFVESAAHELRLDAAQLRFGARAGRAEEMAHSPVPVQRLQDTLGWTPGTTISEGVRRTAEAMGTRESVA